MVTTRGSFLGSFIKLFTELYHAVNLEDGVLFYGQNNVKEGLPRVQIDLAKVIQGAQQVSRTNSQRRI